MNGSQLSTFHSSSSRRSISASGDRSPFFSGVLERLLDLESRSLLTLRERLLDLERLRERDFDRDSFLLGERDFSRESRDLDLERLLLLDFERLLLLERDSRLRERERDLERLELRLRFPRPLRPRSSTNRMRRPFRSVSSSLSMAAFISAAVANSTTPSLRRCLWASA